jgi:hypothetical protein
LDQREPEGVEATLTSSGRSITALTHWSNVSNGQLAGTTIAQLVPPDIQKSKARQSKSIRPRLG